MNSCTIIIILKMYTWTKYMLCTSLLVSLSFIALHIFNKHERICKAMKLYNETHSILFTQDEYIITPFIVNSITINFFLIVSSWYISVGIAVSIYDYYS